MQRDTMDSSRPDSKTADQNWRQDPTSRNDALPDVQGDAEKHAGQDTCDQKKGVYAGLSWLDRLLVLWILFAIIVGMLLGNFVDDVGPTLQRGQFVNVSIPIGTQL